MSTKFSMPIVAAGSNYQAIAARTTVATVGSRGLEIKIEDANADESRVYTTLGGGVTFFPDPAPATTGTFVQYAWIKDAAGLSTLAPDVGAVPKDVPKPGMIVYENMDKASVETFVTGQVAVMPLSKLQKGWGIANPNPVPNPTPDQMRMHLVEKTMEGAIYLYIIEGETEVGLAGTYTDGLETGAKLMYYWYDTDVHTISDRNADRELSPIPFIESLPDVDPKWANHPLVRKVVDIAIPLDAYLKFEVYNPQSNSYVPLNNVVVQLWDANEFIDEQLLQGTTFTTDADGRVTITAPNVRTLSTGLINDPYADIYIKVNTSGKTVAKLDGTTLSLPDEWVSRTAIGEWKAMDQTPGYFPNFRGTRIGTVSQPAVFHIGFDYHVSFWYHNPGQSRDENATRGMLVEVWSGLVVPDQLLDSAYTDELGVVHGVFFDINPGDKVMIINKWELKPDPTIGMKRVDATLTTNVPIVDWAIHELNYSWVFVDSVPTIGRPGNPVSIEATGDFANPLYILKIAREINQFLYIMTDGSPNRWDGLEMTYNIHRVNSSGLSWPIGEVWLGKYSSWSRETIFHETGHAVMWHMHNVNSWNVALETALGDLHTSHYSNDLRNPVHAVIEGWAEFFGIFGEIHADQRRNDVANVSQYVGDVASLVSLGPTPLNRGYSVEGAFANALFQIVENCVISSSLWNNHPTNYADTKIVLYESLNGDLLQNPKNAWVLDGGIRDRFRQMIWQPFIAASNILDDNHGTITIMNSILNYGPNASIIHLLRAEMNAFNMAVVPISVTAITSGVPPGGGAPEGPAVGGTSFTITGANFVARSEALGSSTVYVGEIAVLFDGVLAQAHVVDGGTISGVTPRRVVGGKTKAGLVTVEVLLYVRLPSTTTFTIGSMPPLGWSYRMPLAVQWKYT